MAVASGARAESPPAMNELLRAPGFTTPLYVESRQFWAFSPKTVVLVEGQQAKARFVSGSEFLGEIASVGSTSKGWLIGSTSGVWEVRLNDGDLRHLPEMGEEGVYRFGSSVAFTDQSVFLLERPWERFAFDGYSLTDVNDWYVVGDTLSVATRRGVKRLIWERRTWDDAPLGADAEKARTVRFIEPAQFNEIADRDSTRIRPVPLLVAENHLFYEDSGANQWAKVEGVRFAGFSRADADSVYLRVPDVVFRDTKSATAGSESSWYRWLVSPNGVCRLELPDRGVPVVIGQFPLLGDVRGTYVDGEFVWIATTEDLFVIDREFDNVDQFIAEDDFFVWGFVGEPLEFTNPRQDERGWYCLTTEGMTEVFSASWSWDAYGLDEFDVESVWAAAPDIDGMWVGTNTGLRWFSAVTRTWDRSRVPRELVDTPVYRLEWKGTDLVALTGKGVYSSTKRARSWREVATFTF
jgi:hypothetical protein